MDEDKVTKSIASFLSCAGWNIISINSPFAGRSIWIKPVGGKRGKGVLIPDVLATRQGELIIVESSAPYKVSDEKKLIRYLERPYLESIRAMFAPFRVSWILLAVGLPLSDEHHVRSTALTVFAVADSLRVTVRQAGSRYRI